MGELIILSGPSGVGKSSIIKRLLEDERFSLSVSATTRAPRPGEVEGEDYYFLDDAEFRRRIEAGEFLEWAEVHGKSFYGTLRDDVSQRQAAGRTVILDIDVQGAALLRQEEARRVFIAPPSFDELERRLRDRGTETEERIARRLETAREELNRAQDYDHVVVNDELESTVEFLKGLLFDSKRQKEDAS
jgi:guanylate kinase